VFTTTADGVDLWWEREGDGPAVLPVPGRGDPSDLFPEDFTAGLLHRGLSVVRWDPRDTGLSGDGGSAYTVRTMADDAVAVLDAAGIGSAHVVGVSMAGLILTHLAVRHPERAASLTFVAAMSPEPAAGIGEDFFAALDGGDPVDGLVRAMGDTSADDRLWAAAQVAAAERRAPARPEAVDRHQEAAFRLDWPTPDDLASIMAPCLVVHGRLDRVLPLAHAEALRKGIRGATRWTVDDMGHLPRPADWAAIAETIADRAGTTSNLSP
jgi:3-oxoadipate enol-lactonase